MTQWFVKDLAELTKISVQTLHYYDRIGLLKPSLRLANGYRVYSEKDLLQLQRIIALKFFGFELSQIKSLLKEKDTAVKHFNKQALVLEQKAAALEQSAKTLKSIIRSIDQDKSVQWETIIQLIEVYKMTTELEHHWVREIFTPDELKQYAEFESTMKASHKKEGFEKEWRSLLAEVKQSLKQDPCSAIGIQTGKHYMEWVNRIYGKKYAHLRTKKWEKGFGEGKGLEEIGLTLKDMEWLEKAVNAYWRDRLHTILQQVDQIPEPDLLALWNNALEDMYGEEDSRKKAVYEMALKDDKLSPRAKVWLKSI